MAKQTTTFRNADGAKVLVQHKTQTNVRDYFADLFPRWDRLMDHGEMTPSYEEFPISSLCGVRCVEIMHRANALLAICDPNSHESILEGVVDAIETICFG